MRSDFGTTSRGEKASLYTLKNQNGMEIAVSDYGAVLVKVLVPDRDGNLQDVVLGYDDVKGYESGTLYFGATVGRIANRIKGGTFELGGQTYSLTQNDNKNTLHGNESSLRSLLSMYMLRGYLPSPEIPDRRQDCEA